MKKSEKSNNALSELKNKEKTKYGVKDYIIVFFAVFVLFLLSMKFEIKNNESAIKALMSASLIGLGVYTFWKYRQNKLTASSLLGIIVVAGMIMRIGYMLYTHMFVRGHDLGQFTLDDYGHLSYILKVAKGYLPESNTHILYHPPFYYFLASALFNIGKLFYADEQMAFEFTQIVNCTASCYMLMVLRGFLSEISIKDKYRICALAIIAFFPNFMLMGGRLNNDMIVTLCMLLCVVYTYRWYKNRDIKSVVILALSFGIGMMTKVSCGIIALITGPVMIYCLVTDFRKKQYKEIILQLAVFAVICFPLALWYPIRNYILFDQPLNYVLRLSEGYSIYTGDVEWYKRFFDIRPTMLVSQPFAKMDSDYSILLQVMRSSVAGEFTFDGMDFVFSLVHIVNIFAMLLSLAAMIYVVKADKKLAKELRFGFFAVWAVVIGSFIQFNIEYTFICTADFRYIALTAVIGAVYIAYAMQLADESGNKYVRYVNKIAKVIYVVWCVLCCAVYL